MFWVILLVVVAVIVFFCVKGSRKAKENRKAVEALEPLETRTAAGDEEAKEELKKQLESMAAKGNNVAKGKLQELRAKEEDERMIKELESKAAAGDATAEKLFKYLELKVGRRFVYGSSKSIHYRGLQINNAYSTAGNILLQIIAESDGWDDFSIGNEKDDTKNPKEGSMRCDFTAPTKESCSVTWGYKKGFYDFIFVSINLKLNSILVDSILREFEQKMIGFLKSQGASPVTGSDFSHLARFWNS
jgi:hypothetical protein